MSRYPDLQVQVAQNITDFAYKPGYVITPTAR